MSSKCLSNAIAGGFLGLLVLTSSGCVAVSRSVRREPVSHTAYTSVTGSGHWQVDQEWDCQPDDTFILAHEKKVFHATIADWLESGWEMTDFDVVTVPRRDSDRNDICLVATFRRWSSEE